jgi:4-hydroxy 2-oxovalerate aldolase
MYRPEIRVLDCTIRDGGLINKWQFSDEFVRETYIACAAAGVDYVELGYKASPELYPAPEYGKWRFCRDEDIEKVLEGVERTAKLSCLVDIGRVRQEDIAPCSESPFDMIRVASYVKDIDKAISLAQLCMDRGYETTINIMAVSSNLEKDIDEALAQLAETDVPCVYVVDSYGSMYSEDITFLVKKYRDALPGKTIGMHCHNNRQLAFGNTIQGIIDGANLLDASVFGMARGRQLLPGTPAQLPQEPEVRRAPDPEDHPGPLPSTAPGDRVGLPHSLRDHRHAERAPAHGHRPAQVRGRGQVHRVLRQAHHAGSRGLKNPGHGMDVGRTRTPNAQRPTSNFE